VRKFLTGSLAIRNKQLRHRLGNNAGPVPSMMRTIPRAANIVSVIITLPWLIQPVHKKASINAGFDQIK